MKKFSSGLFYAIIVIGFISLLYWISGSSHAVAQYNGGYGTFDMKNYDVHVVENVLASMSPEGFQASYQYYIADSLFIVFFGVLQCMISNLIYSSLKTKFKGAGILVALSIMIPILRGIADMIENTILVSTLIKYPIIHKIMIEAAVIATNIKLGCIKVWVFFIIAGVLIRIIVKYKCIVHENKC